MRTMYGIMESVVYTTKNDSDYDDFHIKQPLYSEKRDAHRKLSDIYGEVFETAPSILLSGNGLRWEQSDGKGRYIHKIKIQEFLVS